MPVNPAEVQKRWEKIRVLPECDLSLAPEAVREYLSEPESAIVRQRIFETLTQVADYRMQQGPYHSGNDAAGDLATCEGLETFLVPAVENAYPFSEFLRKYPSANPFAAKFREDLSSLLDKWVAKNPLFSGAPYTDMGQIRNAVDPILRSQLEPFNITETAAMACRIAVHILTLKYRSETEVEFIKSIAKEIDDNRLLTALSNGIDFLAGTFQRSNAGTDVEERIANSKWGSFEGSGWSWTAAPAGGTTGLPPMLFFTAAAVDAFAELDLYLIRPGRNNDFTGPAAAIQKFYKDKKDELLQLELCIDMARRWVRSTVLPNLTFSSGQHEEKYPDNQTKITYADQKLLERTKPVWENEGLKSPLLYYNTLYALQILLWSFGDRTDDGARVDESVKGAINRALTMLVYNYDSIPVVKEVLGKAAHIFLLPGHGIFNRSDKEAGCEYLDAGFLPLLTRLLVLFVVYGVGDRNLLEPIIRNLYVELLQRRHRTEPQYGALWSIDKVEVYSTQRAIQALTFYHAYAAGKELVEQHRGADTSSDSIELRNKTGKKLYLQVGELENGPSAGLAPSPATASQLADQPLPAQMFQQEFGTVPWPYLQKHGWKDTGPHPLEGGEVLQSKVTILLQQVFKAGCAGKFRDLTTTHILIKHLRDLLISPVDGKRPKESEYQFLVDFYTETTGLQLE